MNILLTNDDGINGEGLNVLYKKLCSIPNLNVFVMAPDSNRSAVSSLLTMTSPLKFIRKSENVFSCSGSPVDCVISALSSNIFGDVKFDAIISGINKGANLGTDVIYSGTCAAARQATLYKVPGIALSVESYDKTWKFDALAEFCATNLEKLISLCTSDLFLSVNARSSDKYNGVKFTSLAIRDYKDRITILSDPSNRRSDIFYGFFSGGEIESSVRENIEDKDISKTDFGFSSSGGISISRIYAEPHYFVEESERIF